MQRNVLVVLALLTCFSMPPISLGSNDLQGKDLPNFETVSPDLYRGGQPTAIGMQQLKAMGVKTIVSLRHNHSQVLWEQQEADSLGLKFKRIPLDGLHKLSPAKIKEFLTTVRDPDNQPVFVHCQWGLDRTGALVGIYRQEVQKWSAKDAYDEMVALGFEKKYAWLADSVFDYEEDRLGTLSDERPMSVKALDSVQEAMGTRPRRKVRQRLDNDS